MRKISTKALLEMLHGVGVHNDHELFKVVNTTPPLISHSPANKWRSPKWRVWRVGFKTDPNAHWQDGGAKAFVISRHGDETPGQAKARVFTAAVAWASERYTQWSDEWVKTPFGSWAPKDALEVALSHHLPKHFGQVRVPAKPVGDPVVGRITDKLYAEDPEWTANTPNAEIKGRPIGDTSESIRRAFDLLESDSHVDESPNVDVSSVDADGWYRVVGAGVAVFVYATDAANARERVEHMIRRVTMDADVNLHITRRDPEVSQ